VPPALADDIAARFRWVDGHADLYRVLADGDLLARIADALAAPFEGVTTIAAVEARGFMLAGAVAVRLGAGVAAIRKAGALLPGAKLEQTAGVDYRGNEHRLVLQQDVLEEGARVLLVDDWVETGSQARAARALIRSAGGRWAGVATIVDDTTEPVRAALAPFHALLPSAALGPSA
jgi:adenine phosphoribosyltransferase